MINISSNLGSQSGVYQIINKSNGRIYVGSTGNFARRKKEHLSLLNRGIHHSPHLQRAYNKNPKNFSFEIYFVCSTDMLLFYEQKCLDILNPFYNSSKIAGKVEFTHEIREKIGTAQKKAREENPQLNEFHQARMASLGDDHWMKQDHQRQRMRDNNPMHKEDVVAASAASVKKWIAENPDEFRDARRRAGETLRHRHETDPSYGETYSLARMMYASTPEGKQDYEERGKKISATLTEWSSTPEGEEAHKRMGKKSGETRKLRGSQAGDKHWTAIHGGHSEASKAKMSIKKSGENSPVAKLTTEKVLDIRTSNLSALEMAVKYSVTEQTIRDIRKGKTWKRGPFPTMQPDKESE